MISRCEEDSRVWALPTYSLNVANMLSPRRINRNGDPALPEWEVYLPRLEATAPSRVASKTELANGGAQPDPTLQTES